MKKILSVLIVTILLLSCFSFNAFCADDGEVIGATVYGAAASTVELPIKYKGNPGFWIMFLEINFDPEVFEYAGIDDGDYDKAEIVPQTYANKGKVLLDIEGKEYADLTGDGVIATLKLNVKDTAKVGNYQVNLSIGDGMAVDFDVNYVVPKVTSGSVYVVCSNHDFKDNTCSVCGAVKDGEDIKVDLEKLPEPIKPVIKDVDGSELKDDSSKPADGSSSAVANNDSQNNDKKDDAKDTEKPNTVLFVVICGVAVVIIAVVVVIIVKSKKKQID